MNPGTLSHAEPSSPLKRVMVSTLYVLLCITAVAGGALAGFAHTYPMAKFQIFRMFHMPPANPYQGRDDLIVLLLGCDENYTIGGAKVTMASARSDSIHLVRFDFKNKGIGMMDIPRDSRVSVPKHEGVKITALHVYGGEDLVIQGVYQLTGVRAEKVITVNYKFVKQLVDMLGGVEVFVEKNMDYDDNAGHLHIHLKRGWQKLSGEQAVGFMRFRHTDTTEMRSRRQEEFMMALKDEIARQPSAIPDISNLILEMLKTSLSPEEVDYLANFAHDLPANRVKRGSLPGKWNEQNWQWLVEESAVPKALEEAGIIEPRVSANRQ